MLTAIDPAAIAQRVDLTSLTAHASLELRAVNEAAVRRQIEAVIVEVVKEATGLVPQKRECAYSLCTNVIEVGAGRLVSSHSQARYCSDSCRKAASRERNSR